MLYNYKREMNEGFCIRLVQNIIDLSYLKSKNKN